MSASASGLFTKDSLPVLLHDIASRNSAGRCQFHDGTHSATLHFLSHQVVAAETERYTAEAAVYDMLTWLSGHYQFYAEQVLLAHIPRVNRVRQSLQRLLATEHDPNLEPRETEPVEPDASRITSPPRALELSVPAATSLGLSALDLSVPEQGELLPPEFAQTLQNLCAKLIEPVGKLLLQDAADALDTKLEHLRQQDISRLLEALRLELPERLRAEFQTATQGLTQTFGEQK